MRNILFILSDDQGEWAMGCSGNREIVTPHLDRIAAEGMRFTNFFCVSPVCSPARASLFTGRIPSQHGVHDWIADQSHADYLEGMPTVAELLAEQGYVCGLSGKWHLGDSSKPHRGFTHWFAHQSGGGPYYGAPVYRDGVLVREERYITEVFTDEALAFLDRYGGGEQPFFLAVTYTAPHSPWIGQHPQEYVDMYEDCAFDSCPQEPAHPWTIPNPPWGDDVRGNLKGYFAAVTAMDAQIGRLLDKLEELGIREETLVVFMSDNGFSCGQHGFWGKGNGTFPLNLYDSSVKVPALFSLPGLIPQGAVSDALLSGYDVFPTLLEYAGVDFGADVGAASADVVSKPLPGRSFLPLLRGESEEGRGSVVVFDEYGPVRMVRDQEWKYIHRYPYGPHELYHLAEDPMERRNLADDPQYGEVRRRMKAQLDEWFLRYAEPSRDGSREPVTGAGQIGRREFARLKG